MFGRLGPTFEATGLVGRAAGAYIRFGVFSLTEYLDLITHCASPPCLSPDQASPFSYK